MNQDSGVEAVSLKVDGGMTANALLMQFQADLLGVQVLPHKASQDVSDSKQSHRGREAVFDFDWIR